MSVHTKVIPNAHMCQRQASPVRLPKWGMVHIHDIGRVMRIVGTSIGKYRAPEGYLGATFGLFIVIQNSDITKRQDSVGESIKVDVGGKLR